MRALRLRLLSCLLLCALAGTLTTGCWDRREIEDAALVLALGVDKAADEGRVLLTVQIALPRAIGGGTHFGGGNGSTPPAIVESMEGDTITEALRDLETFINRQVTLMHLKAIVFGRELAEDGVDSHIGVLSRNREFRRTILMMVAQGSAQEALTLRPELEKEPSSVLESLARRAAERGSRAPRVNLHDFLLGYEGAAEEPMLPMLRPHRTEPGLEGAGGPVKGQLLGAALFRGVHMVGELSPDETEVLLLLKGRTDRFMESVFSPADEQHQIVADLTAEQRKIAVDVRGPVPLITIFIHTEAEIREVQKLNSDLTEESLVELERRLSRGLQSKAEALLHRLQSELQADYVGFGHYARMRFHDWRSWEAYKWPDRFPKAKIQVTFDTTIRRVGMTFHPVRNQ